MRHLEVLIVASLFALCHVAAPRAFGILEGVRTAVSSFSGGLAVAYVFLHLMPEIEEGGEILGPRIYFVLLLGLTAYYALEVWIHRRASDAGGEPGASEALGLSASCLYNAMLVFTLGQQLPETVALTAVFAASLGLHLLSGDFGFIEANPNGFARRGRWFLVGAVAFGYGLSLVREPHEEAIDMLTALLAGLMIFKVFRKELPDFREARLGPFLAGMGLFLVGHILLGE